MIDFEQGLHIAIALTNKRIYALQEVLPIDQEDGCDDDGKAAFAAAKLIGTRNEKNPLSDFARLGVALDKNKGAKWYINGVLKCSQERLGFLPNPEDILYQVGGEPSEINPECVHVGFGLFTMLDAVQPQNRGDLDAAGTGLVRLTEFEYQHPWKADEQVAFVQELGEKQCKLFGQGGALKIKELKVELRC
jgi:hypothetical protein